jgi:hypothetical protein
MVEVVSATRVKFDRTDSNLPNGYGYDVGQDRVVSWKQDSSGRTIGWKQNYLLNGRYYNHTGLRVVAEQALAKAKVTPVNVRGGVIVPTGNQECESVKFANDTIVYIKSLKKSQYFYAGTTVGEVIRKFAERGIRTQLGMLTFYDVALERKLSVRTVTTVILE